MKRPKNKRSSKNFQNWFSKRQKPIFFSFVMLLSILLVIQGTYAWETYSDEKENKLTKLAFNVVLREKFTPNKTWEPGRETIKEVYVANDGNYPAFVRLSAEEFLLSFKMDIKGTDSLDGTGNVLEIKPKPATTTINEEEVLTWKAEEYFDNSVGKNYYQGLESVPADLSVTGKGFIVGKDTTERENSDLTFMNLAFGEVIDSKPSLTSKYWKYSDGYYYYSERLEPGEVTTLFLEKTNLSSSTPNRLKDALYKIKINMDGSHSIAATLADWGHSDPSDEIYQMLINQVNID